MHPRTLYYTVKRAQWEKWWAANNCCDVIHQTSSRNIAPFIANQLQCSPEWFLNALDVLGTLESGSNSFRSTEVLCKHFSDILWTADILRIFLAISPFWSWKWDARYSKVNFLNSIQEFDYMGSNSTNNSNTCINMPPTKCCRHFAVLAQCFFGDYESK